MQGLIAEQKLRPALQPAVELGDGYAPGGDAEIAVTLEVLPDVPAPAIDNLKLERLTVPVADSAVDEQLQKFADGQKHWDDADKAAEIGDLVTMDFVGKTADGVAFPGGTGTDMAVELGTGRLIPGFEDQVVGARAGEERQISVTFPTDYNEKSLAGKPATFDLTIKSVKTAAEARIDEALAKNLGLESLDQLRGLIRGQVEQESNGLTRTHMKRKLLDQLAQGHDFPVPPSMVDAEFDQIWQQLEHEAGHEPDPDAARAEMETEREDYRRIAERRVRLGLLLSEIGSANGVEVSQQEMNGLIAQAAQQYGPEDRQRFIDYVRQEPMAAAQLRAPLYEDKVVDFLFGKAEVTDRETTREELEAAIESDDGFATGTHQHDHADHDDDHDHDHAPQPKAKRTKKTAPRRRRGGRDPDRRCPRQGEPRQVRSQGRQCGAGNTRPGGRRPSSGEEAPRRQGKAARRAGDGGDASAGELVGRRRSGRGHASPRSRAGSQEEAGGRALFLTCTLARERSRGGPEGGGARRRCVGEVDPCLVGVRGAAGLVGAVGPSSPDRARHRCAIDLSGRFPVAVRRCRGGAGGDRAGERARLR